MIEKPESSEYNPFFQGYMDYVIDQKDILQFIKNQQGNFLKFIQAIPLEKHNFAYASGKWTVKQVLRHMIDTERMFGYRVMSIARNEKSMLPGFDENGYVEEAHDTGNSFQDLVDEFDQLRSSTISLISNLAPSIQQRTGDANGSEISVRSIVFIIAGHLAHHTAIISERYL